jgi:hypothetical protein
VAADRIARDCARRWAAGRRAHGGGPWQGQHPLLELDEELLDALNYLDEAVRQGADSVRLYYLRDGLRGLVTLLRRNPDYRRVAGGRDE